MFVRLTAKKLLTFSVNIIRTSGHYGDEYCCSNVKNLTAFSERRESYRRLVCACLYTCMVLYISLCVVVKGTSVFGWLLE